jgi:hypothetical protein
MHDACTFAQHFHGTSLGAAAAQDVGVENPQCRTANVAGANALDEPRYVDVGGTGAGTGRVETIQATIRFNDCSLRLERRFDVAESLAQQ